MISIDYFLLAQTRPPTSRLPEMSPWFDRGHEILEVGCSTGNLTIELARQGYRVLACEPDDVARGIAVDRLAGDPNLRTRVTVLPMTVAGLPLPERLGGALLSHVLFYLDAEERASLWARLAEHVMPGASVLISRAWPTTVAPVNWKILGEPLTLGRFTYRRWFSSEPAVDAATPSMRYLNTFEVLDGERVVHRDESVEVRPVLSEETALSEIDEAFDVIEVDDGWLAAVRR